MGDINSLLTAAQEVDTLFPVLQGGATRYLPGSLIVPKIPRIEVLTETHLASLFTDGGGTSGTKVMSGSIPVGAILLGSKVLVPAGFAGDTTAVLIIGDGSDTDRYMTGTPSIFATAANGIETGVPSGSKLITTANSPTLTVTSSTDFALVMAGGGRITVSIFYMLTV